MKTISCPQCNLTNWVTAITCKRCEIILQPVGETVGVGAHVVDSEHSFAELNETEITKPKISRRNLVEENRRTVYQQQSFVPLEKGFRSSGKLQTRMAVASMVLGVLAFLTSIFLGGIIFAPVGLILGILAWRNAAREPKIYGGKNFAMVGIVLSTLMILFTPLVLVVAIPNFLAARRAANESLAVSAIKQITAAQSTYMASTFGKCGDLQTLVATKLIDVSLATNEKDGYRFLVVNLPAGGCEILATPLADYKTNRSFYYSTEDGFIRGAKKNGKPADKNDFPLSSEPPVKPKQPPKLTL